jgi:Aspartyl protease
MQIQLRDDLPFVSVSLIYQGQEISIPDVLIDTGSATSMFSADRLAVIGISPQAEDNLYTIRGVGGAEVVYVRRVERMTVGSGSLANFEIEVGGMDYGFDIQGILGMNFLIPAGAVIDINNLDITFLSPKPTAVSL